MMGQTFSQPFFNVMSSVPSYHKERPYKSVETRRYPWGDAAVGLHTPEGEGCILLQTQSPKS